MTPSPHGTKTEKPGCHCDWCRRTQSIRQNKLRGRQERGEVMWVDIKVPRHQLRMICRRWPQRRVAKELGTSQSSIWRVLNGDTTRVRPQTAAKIARLYHDICTEVPKIGRRFPAEPLIEQVVERYGSLSSAGMDVKQRLFVMSKTGMSVDQCDKWAMELVGKMPYEIWPEWNRESA